MEPLREALNRRLGRNEHWQEWEIPRVSGDPWSGTHAKLHAAARDESVPQKKRAAALANLNAELGRAYTLDTLPEAPVDPWTDAEAIKLHAAWWEARIARQREIDGSIARAAEVEYLYDCPYADNSKVRVAGPFTVESLSPHRVVHGADRNIAAKAFAAVRLLRPYAAQVEPLRRLKNGGSQFVRVEHVHVRTERN